MRKLRPVLRIEVVACLPDLADLLGEGITHDRVAVSQRDRADACQEVEIFLARQVHESGSMAKHRLDREPAIGMHNVLGVFCHEISHIATPHPVQSSCRCRHP